MKNEEKNLIENLFHRLKNTELNSSERDHSADNLIQKLVKNQPSSSYYMAQTILIQETAIKKMSLEIEELRKKITDLKSEEVNKKPSFLSNLFKSDPSSKTTLNNDHVWKNKASSPIPAYHTSSMNPQTGPFTASATDRSSGFLKNALQTATGVAGGMILGNMLMNVFNHSKPEEEIFDNVNQSSEDHIQENSFYDSNHHNLVDYEDNSDDVETNLNNDFDQDDKNSADYMNEFDENDDNFV